MDGPTAKDGAYRYRQMLKANAESRLPVYPTDYFYRSMVPKDPFENVEFRRRLLDLCYETDDETYRDELWLMCSRDILFYTNSIGYTINPKDYADNPVRPFITWPCQDAAFHALQAAIGNHHINVPKSREMGASWMCLIAIEHRWHFMAEQKFLLCSRTQEYVDSTGNDKALFQKLDFWHKHQPDFLLPAGRELGQKDPNRLKNHLGNSENGSTIDGEANVPDLGRGDRRTAILPDEFAFTDNAVAMSKSMNQATNCVIRNSTPNGRYGQGAEFFRYVKNPNISRVFLHWSEAPEKREGLYCIKDGERVPLPDDYNWRDHYDFNMLTFVGTKPRSPWYDGKCAEAGSPIEIAQELDIDFIGSSEKLADEPTIHQIRLDDCMPPHDEGELYIDEMSMEADWRDLDGGPFRLWCEFDGAKPAPGQYIVGADIGAGTGGEYTSNSALVIFNQTTREQVGEFASNKIPPVAFARFSVGVCKWFHNALLVPEINGPNGTVYINEARQLYSNIYRQLRGKVGYEEKTDHVGYFARKAAEVLTPFVEGMKFGRVKVRSERILDEIMEYEYDAKSGNVRHGGSTSSQAGSDKGTTHGDIAIAAGTGYVALREYVATQKMMAGDAPVEMPPNCPAARHKERMAREESDSGRNEFIFS